MSELSQRLTAALADRYRIERELGQGGMATVFLAQDLKHPTRRVAIKVLDPELAAAIGAERFLREIETTASLTHPLILKLYDSGQVDGLLYYVMPYVEGESLRERLTREKQLPLDDALRIAGEVAEALSYAHSHGVVHRDIKPENILLEQGHAVVADFGIARAVAAVGREKLTATGVSVGTPIYMSPEQAAGSRDLDGRSDLYSLGCVVYEMLAGQPPFTGPTAESLVHQHLSVTPRPVTELRPAVPAGVVATLQRALAKAPADRFNTVAQFGEALGQHETPPKLSIARWLAAGAVVLVALLAVGVWQRWGPFSQWPSRQANHPAGHKDWILVADFDGPADDTTLATAARSLVSAALDESEILATVSRGQIQLALKQAGKPVGTRVTGQVARELAYRRSVRAVLEGEIERIGTGYSIVLRVVNAESLKTVVTERASAKDKDGLIPALGKMAEKLRRDLGERHDAIAATRPLHEYATPSFEAYRAYIKARLCIYYSSDCTGESAIALCYEALRLDPDFVAPWLTIATVHSNMGRRDSALVALDQAARHRERMSTTERLELEALRAALSEGPEQALAVWSRLDQLTPGNPMVLINSGACLAQLGRYEEALARTEEAERHLPFGPANSTINNTVLYLLFLGRIDEARERAKGLEGIGWRNLRAGIELAACNWAAAESLAEVQTRDARAGVLDRRAAFVELAKARAGRGQLRAAAATLSRGLGSLARRHHLHPIGAGLTLLLLAVQTDGAIALPPESWAGDSSVASLYFLGLRAAASGDVVSVRRLLGAIPARPTREKRPMGAATAVLEARVAALTGRWEEVVRILQPIAAQSYVPGGGSGLTESRFLLADAFEKLGAPDSAATCLERITTDPTTWFWSGVAKPLAERRLILLDARMGRLEEAQRHLAVLERWWDRPDDIARRMLDEARSAVGSARGMARPERAGT